MNQQIVNEQHTAAQELLDDFNLLRDDELKEFLNRMLRNEIGELDDRYKYLLAKDSDVERKVKNNHCEQISIYFHDGIEIDTFGIYYKPEHGNRQQLLSFWMVEVMRGKFFYQREY